MAKEYLNLPIREKHHLSVDKDKYLFIQDELEDFLDCEKYLNSRTFARKVMLSQEVKSNNTIEGINDDILLIEEAIKDALTINDNDQRKRIINLYNGYKYILTHHKIDEVHLKELYSILSDGLIIPSDLKRMGDIYRNAPVYILKKGRLDLELDTGLPEDVLSEYMNYYFEYINNDNNFSSITDYFIKSQIMHFYFVYIHPYFDVNGRTSRTLAMWYLLNNKSYPYIIFNRAINFDSKNYDRAIIDTKNFADISFFIKYMLVNVKKELEKEYIMNQVASSVSSKLEGVDYQTLLYYLSMNGEINVLSFASTYQRFNDHKSVKNMYLDMIDPLIKSGVFEVVRYTNKNMFEGYKNICFRLNPKMYDKESEKIKRLSLQNK